MNKKIVAIIFVIIVLLIGGYFVFSKKANSPVVNEPQNPLATATTTTEDTSNWQTFKNDNFGFAIKFPQDATLNVLGMSRMNWEVKFGSLSVFIGLVGKGQIQSCDYKNIADYLTDLGNVYAYEINPTPPKYLIMTNNKDYDIVINGTCDFGACSDKEVDYQSKIINSISLINGNESVKCK